MGSSLTEFQQRTEALLERAGAGLHSHPDRLDRHMMLAPVHCET
jgi:hypothetical protein